MPKRIQQRRTGQRVSQCIRCDRPCAKGQRGYCSPECRFWSKVIITDSCWHWTGAQHSAKGYGRVDIRRRRWLAHRFSYTLVRGPIQGGMELDHLYKNTHCVNPQHLEQVTPEEHATRSDQGAYNRNKTHCSRGHEYVPGNVRLSNARRHCRKCDSSMTGSKGSQNSQAKLSESVVARARELRSAGMTVKDLTSMYGVAQSVMSRALSGRTWKHVN